VRTTWSHKEAVPARGLPEQWFAHAPGLPPWNVIAVLRCERDVVHSIVNKRGDDAAVEWLAVLLGPNGELERFVHYNVDLEYVQVVINLRLGKMGWA
jgi:hypothetical protein